MACCPFEGPLSCRPDWGACQALAAAVVNASQPCPSPEGACAMGAFQPVPSQKMYAVTGLYTGQTSYSHYDAYR